MKNIVYLISALAYASIISAAGENTTTSSGALNTTVSSQSNSDLCKANMNHCDLSCANATKPTVNTCDDKSLEWDCQCPSNSSQTLVDGSFPVAFQACNKDFNECFTKCNKDFQSAASDNTTSFNVTSCSADCNKDFKCGTKDAPEAFGKKGSSNSSSDKNDKSRKDANSASAYGASAVLSLVGAGFIWML
ncbi:hypothetical protein MIR68_010398 [Amoeboaphelidium protococcarum]|nr:hypothetical protein MIR68_010398 [Amoeboaphelidium protococcarum]